MSPLGSTARLPIAVWRSLSSLLRKSKKIAHDGSLAEGFTFNHFLAQAVSQADTIRLIKDPQEFKKKTGELYASLKASLNNIVIVRSGHRQAENPC